MHVESVIRNLHDFWRKEGCSIITPYDMPMGAATFHPQTFFRALSDKPSMLAYVQPVRRPGDDYMGGHPHKMAHYHQYQVIIQPTLDGLYEIFTESLRTLGVDDKENDLLFNPDIWESPTLGAYGKGYEVRLNGLEIAQITQFSQMGGQKCPGGMYEIAYGVERLAMHLQKCNNIHNVQWDPLYSVQSLDNDGVPKYLALDYDFSEAHAAFLKKVEDLRNFTDANGLRSKYDLIIELSHMFNLIDASAIISPDVRETMIRLIRDEVHELASNQIYMESFGGKPVKAEPPKIPERKCTHTFNFGAPFHDLPTEVIEEAVKDLPYVNWTREKGIVLNVPEELLNADRVVRDYRTLIEHRLERMSWLMASLNNPDRIEVFKYNLAKVPYHFSLGSVADRIERAKMIAPTILDYLGRVAGSKIKAITIHEIPDTLDQCMLDLRTQIVKESPRLQGVIAAHCLRNTGTADSIEAIKTLNNTSLDLTDKSSLRMVVVLALELERIICMLAVGQKFTSSKDPYGLNQSIKRITNIFSSIELSGNNSRPVNRNNSLAYMLDDIVPMLVENIPSEKRSNRSVRGLSQECVYRIITAVHTHIMSDPVRILRLPEEVHSKVVQRFVKVRPGAWAGTIDRPSNFHEMHSNILKHLEIMSAPHYKRNNELLKRIKNFVDKPEKFEGSMMSNILDMALLKKPEEAEILRIIQGSHVSSCDEMEPYFNRAATRFLNHGEELNAAIDKYFESVNIMDAEKDVIEARKNLLVEAWFHLYR